MGQASVTPPLTKRFEYWASHFGVRPMLVQVDARHSYKSIEKSVRACANSLGAAGVRAGDVVSFQLPNWYEAFVVYLATNRIGATANPIIPIYGELEVEFILRESRAKILFVPASYRKRHYARLAAAMSVPNLSHIVAIHDRTQARDDLPAGVLDFDSFLSRASLDVPAAGVAPNDEALLLYTSGTEANPKGVRHGHAGLDAESRSMTEDAALAEGERIFIASPLGHIAGIDFGIHVPIALGGTVCLLDAWKPSDALELILAQSCRWSTGATPFLRDLVSVPDASSTVRRLKGFRCGGADVPPSLIREAHRLGLFAYRTYGCTEHPTITGRSETFDKAAETDGRPAPGTSIKIVDPDDPSRELSYGNVGEVYTKGPELFLGYRDDALNVAAFGADGWFKTGDLGSFDADGYLTISGRKKDIIIRKGENISAKQIEDLIVRHPAVRDVAVIGLPDAERGELVCAVIVRASSQEIDVSEIAGFLDKSNLSRRKFPERIEIVDEMPRTATGKIRKTDLRARFASKR